MDIINLVLYKEAKRIAKLSKQRGDPQDLIGVYEWLCEVKNVHPDLETILLEETNWEAQELCDLPSNGQF